MADDAGLKECRLCHEIKSTEEFGVRVRTVRRAMCKTCLNERKREYHRKNPEQYQKHREISTNARRKRLFGITSEEYEHWLKAQNGVCAICKSAPDGDRLGVDHDHKTGQARGLLCRCCNTGLGMFRDNPDLLHRAIFYLTERTK